MNHFIDEAPLRDAGDYSGLPKMQFANHSTMLAPPVAPTAAPGKFQFGTLDITNTLDTLRVYNGTVIQYDRDLLAEQIAMLLEAQNALTAEQLAMLSTVTTERFIRQGGVDTMVMEDIDQVGLPSAQKVWVTGSEQGWPLRRKGAGLQWTHEYFHNLPMRIFANQMQSLLTADSVAVSKEVRRAIFKATNTSFTDRFKDSYILPVKALVNADGFAIPPNAYGTTFSNGAHTHYMYCGSGNGDTVTDGGGTAWNNAATPANKAANLNALLKNLREHYTSGQAMILVSQTEAAFFTDRTAANIIPGFAVLEYNYIVPATSRDSVAQSAGVYNAQNTYNRLLGYFDGAEVWVKPWIPAGYLFAYDTMAPKPVALRVPDAATVGQTASGSTSLGNGDLRFVYEYDTYPLYAQAVVRDFGAGASSERQNGCVMSVNSVSTYATPTSLA